MVRLLFDMRSSMTRNIKDNFSSMFDNKRCNLNCNDPEAVDSQSHVLQCNILLDNLSPEELLEEVKWNIATYLGPWNSRGRWSLSLLGR